MLYGQKSTGKSQIIGSLFENHDYHEHSLIYNTFNMIFNDKIEEDEDNDEQMGVYISCYEVFLETLTDLFDETNEGFQTETDATWLKVSSHQTAMDTLKMAFLNRK